MDNQNLDPQYGDQSQSQHRLRSSNPRSNGRALSSIQVFGYSVGHVHNDLCSALWFTYLLVFMESVLQFDASTAGLLLFIGQIADAIATPLVGLESDRDLSFCVFGKRKGWHFFGTIASAFSFPMIFQKCYGAQNTDKWVLVFYYSMLIIIFQFAWAAIQISHLSLATELTPHSKERSRLMARRSGFQVISNVAVYVVTWVALKFEVNGSGKFSPEDAPLFRIIVIVLTLLGLFASTIFHLFVKEGGNVDRIRTASGTSVAFNSILQLRWYHWFRKLIFYQMAFLWMCTRLVLNLTQVFIPMYLQYSLDLHKSSTAYIPLTIYCSGYCGSLFVEAANVYIKKKNTYLAGSIMSVCAFVWIYFGDYDGFSSVHIYFVAILLGLSSQIILINSLSFLNDMIGHNTSSSAFVFGAMSFMDKFSNGFAVMIIQWFRPEDMLCDASIKYFRNVLAFACGGSSVLAAAITLSLSKSVDYCSRRSSVREHNSSINNEEQALINPVKDEHL